VTATPLEWAGEALVISEGCESSSSLWRRGSMGGLPRRALSFSRWRGGAAGGAAPTSGVGSTLLRKTGGVKYCWGRDQDRAKRGAADSAPLWRTCGNDKAMSEGTINLALNEYLRHPNALGYLKVASGPIQGSKNKLLQNP